MKKIHKIILFYYILIFVILNFSDNITVILAIRICWIRTKRYKNDEEHYKSFSNFKEEFIAKHMFQYFPSVLFNIIG